MKTLQANLIVSGIPLACIAGCSRSYSFTGVVVGGQGAGIIDAKIIIYPHDWERPEYHEQYRDGKTESDGVFQAGWCCATGVESFRMVVSKPGYDEDIRIVAADEKDNRVVLSVANENAE